MPPVVVEPSGDVEPPTPNPDVLPVAEVLESEPPHPAAENPREIIKIRMADARKSHLRRCENIAQRKFELDSIPEGRLCDHSAGLE